jgi:hypothetical protein
LVALYTLFDVIVAIICRQPKRNPPSGGFLYLCIV